MPWRAVVRRIMPVLLAAGGVYLTGTRAVDRTMGASPEVAAAVAGHEAEQTAQAVIALMAGLAADVESVVASLPDGAVPSETVSRSAALNDTVPTREDYVRTLFDRLAEARASRVISLPAGVDESAIGVTVEGPDGVALAWSGRAAAGSPGTAHRPPWGATISDAVARVWHARALVDRAGPSSRGTQPVGGGAVLVEWTLPDEPGTGPARDGFWRVGTRAVSLRLSPAPPAASVDAAPTFLLTAPSGAVLFSGEVSGADAAVRALRWKLGIRSASLTIVALGLLLLLRPLLSWGASGPPGQRWLASLGAALPLVGAWWVARLASPADWWPHDALTGLRYASVSNPLLRSPLDAALSAALLLALAALVSGVTATRARRPGTRLTTLATASLAGVAGEALLRGLALVALVEAYRRVVRDTALSTTYDLRQFAILDWNIGRLLLQMALVGVGAAVVLLGVTCLRGRRSWRTPTALAAACWLAPLTGVQMWRAGTEGLAGGDAGVVLLALVCAVGAMAAGTLDRRLRGGALGWRATCTGVVLGIAAVAIYPGVAAVTARAARDLVETRLAIEVRAQRGAVKARLQEAMAEVDAYAGLTTLLSPGAGTGVGVNTERAFGLWQATGLSAPVSSSVELSGSTGELLSRFAFNLPEVSAPDSQGAETECEWAISEEVLPFFGEDRRVWRAARGVCADDGAVAGAVTLHATLDPGDLPFLAPASPYIELLRNGEGRPAPGVLGRDVEYAVYGWSGRSLYASRAAAWTLTESALEGAGVSRRPFWTTLTRGADAYDVLVFSDRGGIHALGLPVTSWAGHATGLAEALVVAGVMVILALLAAALLGPPGSPRVGSLWGGMPTSYYRRLLAAFVAAAVVPVLGLALLFRASVAGQIRAGIELDAVRIASAAQRAIVDLAPGRGGQVDDDLLVWVSRLVGEDVNVYSGATLAATSGRTLFASGLLSPRTPAPIYRDLVLGLRAESVTEDQFGAVRYLTVGVPMRASAAPAVVTVPLALRQQEVDAEIDLLDRRVLLVALVFIVGGGAVGFLFAERMADPVRRLARATRRVGRGDLDVSVLVRSAGEFQRLAEDFNTMASQLRRQRVELERTNRLEAWSEVARQVAHDIKNPLTPIQLNAEHLRRVHTDQGAPMGAVVDACTDTILTQVRLLRTLASEFSSFASTPAVRPEAVHVTALLDALLAPYLLALDGQVEFRQTVARDLPPVSADPVLASRALSNLLENALQAMGSRGALRVDARPAADVSGRDGVRITIGDSGPGMDDRALARAFEPYFSTKATGTGLGLPIARRNIEACGGTVAMESVAGSGTTVTVWLPCGIPGPASTNAR